jgi:hypothetical protein
MDWQLREDIREVLDKNFSDWHEDHVSRLEKALEGIEDLIDQQENKGRK